MTIEDRIIERLELGPATLTGIARHITRVGDDDWDGNRENIAVHLGRMISEGRVITDCKVTKNGKNNGYLSINGPSKSYVKVYMIVR